MKTLYLECTSGISGDMTVAALLDLGADPDVLRQGLHSLSVDGYHIHISRVQKNGIDACDFDVVLADGEHHSHPAHTNESGDHRHEHNHDHEHTHDHDHNHDHGHDHEHGHDHDHDHSHEHSVHTLGSHVHRNLGDIVTIIDSSGISPAAKKMARDIFTVVATAEARVHNLPLDQVHFHEVGAVDSIVDIVGAAICLDNLGIGKVLCSPLREGTGTVRCQHGVIPVPAPATLAIVQEHRIPLIITDNVGEMVTPTGAAIVAALVQDFSVPAEMVIQAVGYGAGKRNYKTSNLLRAMLIEESSESADTAESADSVLQLDCNLDDMTGEQLAYACEQLLAAGALDVWCTPITMKKSRPAQLLSVLAPPALEQAITRLILTHTTTIGVRCSKHRRHVMDRTFRTVDTVYGPVQVKDCAWGDVRKTTVEYESARMIAEKNALPLEEVYRTVYQTLK